MNLFHKHGVVDLQSMKSVSESLNKAIVSICKICTSLTSTEVNPTTGACSNYNQIRGHIETAYESMRNAEKIIQEKLVHLNECMEQLIREKHNFEQQKNEKIMTLNKLHEEKRSAEVSLEYVKAALTQALKNLESANYALRVQQDRRNAGEGLSIAGGVLLVIPIIGWIAGSIMLSQGVRELNEALNAITDAEHERQKFDVEVMECSAKVHDYQKKIQTTHNETEKTNEALRMIDLEIIEVQRHLEDTGNIQDMVSKAVNLLSVLSGRVTVLERQTQRFILWEPVVKVMEDVMKAIVNITENRLLYSDGVPGLVNTLKNNVEELLTLGISDSNYENDGYY